MKKGGECQTFSLNSDGIPPQKRGGKKNGRWDVEKEKSKDPTSNFTGRKRKKKKKKKIRIAKSKKKGKKRGEMQTAG